MPSRRPRRCPALTAMYRGLNRRWWGGRLPKNLLLAWMPSAESQRLGVLARTTYYRVEKGGGGRPEVYAQAIAVSRRIQFSSQLVQGRLLHEMAHVACGYLANHGPTFRAEMLRLAQAGAFDRVW